jgi:hypothetical protein
VANIVFVRESNTKYNEGKESKVRHGRAPVSTDSVSAIYCGLKTNKKLKK